MHHANHFYGHAHIMARYTGLHAEDPPRIRGYLQHGWNILDGFAIGTNLVPGAAKFVWSRAPFRRGWSMGRRDYYVVGAPWNYLVAMEPQLGAVPEDERKGTIWYPFHGWEGQQILGDHSRLIAQIKEVEQGPVTVCLYWNEYRLPQLLRLYKNAGFRVICHGLRGYNYRNTDTRFLYKQLTELRSHRRVASNRLGSAILYGVSAGCVPAVYGDPMILQAEDPAFGGMSRMSRLWPELHGTDIDIEAARTVASVELGADALASPEEIRAVFGWTNAQRASSKVATA